MCRSGADYPRFREMTQHRGGETASPPDPRSDSRPLRTPHSGSQCPTFLHVCKALFQLVIHFRTKGKVIHKYNTARQGFALVARPASKCTRRISPTQPFPPRPADYSTSILTATCLHHLHSPLPACTISSCSCHLHLSIPPLPTPPSTLHLHYCHLPPQILYCSTQTIRSIVSLVVG